MGNLPTRTLSESLGTDPYFKFSKIPMLLLCALDDLIIKNMKIFGFGITKGLTIKFFLVMFTAIITYFWLDFAPDGLLGKMDAVGYAVCHRIDERSFHLGERALPLCARCSGMQLGALMGLAYQSLWGRRGKFPPAKILTINFFDNFLSS